jgi:hypothetical protein
MKKPTDNKAQREASQTEIDSQDLPTPTPQAEHLVVAVQESTCSNCLIEWVFVASMLPKQDAKP